MASWPASLPSALPHPVEVADRDTRIRTRMSSGVYKMRTRNSAIGADVRHGGLILTDTQRAALETFYVTTTSYGVDSWTWTHPTLDTTVSFRFTSRPTYVSLAPNSTTSARKWVARFDLEILP